MGAPGGIWVGAPGGIWVGAPGGIWVAGVKRSVNIDFILKSGCPIGVPTWVPDRVPIRGPEGARKENNITKWNRANMCTHGTPTCHMPAPKGQ